MNRREFLAGAFATGIAGKELFRSPYAGAEALSVIPVTPDLVDRGPNAVDIAGHPIVQYGNADAGGSLAVRKTQHRLNAKGFNAPIGVDGAFGPITQSRVQEFQKIWNLPQTGVMDPVTWSHLLMETPPVAPAYGHAIVLDQSLRHVWIVGANNGRTQVYVEGDVVDNPAELAPGEYRTIEESHLPVTSSYASNKRDPGNLVLKNFTGFAAGGDIGFHQIPYDKDTLAPLHDETALGVPPSVSGQLSKGCTRVSAPMAAHIFGMQIGTRVIVHP